MEQLINFIPAALLAGIFYLITKSTMKIRKPVQGRITSPFGDRVHPVTKTEEFHNGVDLAAAIGTPVVCPLPGKVNQVYNNDIGGLQLIIVHTNGWRTGYAHLSKVNVKVGDTVKDGQIVALTGNSGRGTGPHLHFTLTDTANNKVDPAKHFL